MRPASAVGIGNDERRLGRADAGELRAEVAPALLDHFFRNDLAAHLLEFLDEDRAQGLAVRAVLVDDRRRLVAERLDRVLGDLALLVVGQRVV
jgi:hypothetical protein